ncbi:MAG: hypothetical protein M0Z52_07460 [Actinomycetota bacterium]|nr:hypothetical protein [Actinomycetota bacterium]
MLKAGDKIIIYRDTETQTDPEGEAVLLEREIRINENRIRKQTGCEYWFVQFTGDHMVATRAIRARKSREAKQAAKDTKEQSGVAA